LHLVLLIVDIAADLTMTMVVVIVIVIIIIQGTFCRNMNWTAFQTIDLKGDSLALLLSWVAVVVMTCNRLTCN